MLIVDPFFTNEKSRSEKKVKSWNKNLAGPKPSGNFRPVTKHRSILPSISIFFKYLRLIEPYQSDFASNM